MNHYRPQMGIPPAIKYILIINVLIFLFVNLVGPRINFDFVEFLGMHLPGAEKFGIWQYITHMFTHQDLSHLFFNMFAVWMFGRVLESVWGSKRLLFYYFVTGVGAAALHSLVSWLGVYHMEVQYQEFLTAPDPGFFVEFVQRNLGRIPPEWNNFINGWSTNPTSSVYIARGNDLFLEIIHLFRNITTIGASGAVFGILLAFGMLFPNTELYLMFIPVPIKAKYFVIGYGLIEFFLGVRNQAGDNVAHFAHLGGMLFGFFLIQYWRKHRKNFY